MSTFGLVWSLTKLLNIPIRIRGRVLLFLRPPDIHHRILDVFLLPDNIPLEEVKAQQGEAEYIESSSDCDLINGQSYSVHCDEASRIQPEHEEFHPVDGPIFFPTFEVVLPINQEKVTLMVKGRKGRPVWKCVVNLTGPRRENLQRNLPAGDTVPAERTKMTKTDLINTLDDLVDDEFKSFKSYLKDEKVDNTEPIKVNKLSKADRQETVDLMVQKYEFATAVKVMKSVLKKISRNDLVRKLSNIGSGAEVLERVPVPLQLRDRLLNLLLSKTCMLGLILLLVLVWHCPSVDPTETKLMSVRTQFIARVSEANLHKLLDKLLEREVINDGEMEFAGTLNRAEKARLVIDMVRRKGTEARSALIAALCEVDPFLSKELNLQ
ncbi:uncharacterized protein LOC122972262 [Thunnus albacares]|uniref:uncharacterized protein LOC122972262 n=1 Tax=Thunnus albacares TaxID=8236 RepID=UPI001CF65479|nr:uncharacterized protein LOC122972262 [Thunnus albacares]